ncbi:MAG: ParB/RepB/Spo0J family partition protein [Candidatus Competibacteraceae bacterium]|nr:ParB/RepB/Spo0J family partition protein [Candidatus Competibacteraceae bacterium]
MLLSKLTPNPINQAIYGDEDVSDLAASIRQNGLLSPLICDENLLLISGHRRYRALLSIGTKEVQDEMVEIITNPTPDLIIAYNIYREKTNLQRLREAQYLEIALNEKGIHGKEKYDYIKAKTKLTPKAFIDGKNALAHLETLPAEERPAFEEKINASIGAARASTRPASYWDTMKICAYQLESAYNKLARTRDGQTPKKLGEMIDRLQSYAAEIRKWAPDALVICPACAGTGFVDSGKNMTLCSECLNGRVAG